MRFPHVCKKWGASAQCFPKHANFAAQTASARPILSAAAAIHEGNDQQPHTPSPAAPRPTQSRSAPKAGSPIPRMCVKTYRSERNGSRARAVEVADCRPRKLRAPETAGSGNCGPGNCGPKKLQAQETAGPRNCRPKQLPADDRHAGGLGDWPERSRENGVADEVAKASPCPKPKTASAISSRRLGGRPARRLRNTQDQRGARTCGNLLAGRFGKPS